MKRIDLAVLGFGNVGRAFAEYATRFEHSGIELQIRAISDQSGTVWLEGPNQLHALVEHKRSGASLSQFPSNSFIAGDAAYTVDSLAARGIEFLVECLPSNLRDGQPARDILAAALGSGVHVVTVDKGPLAHGFEVLQKAAQAGGARFGFTGTTGVAIPAELADEKVVEIRGVLNGTTNYILTEMQERGIPFETALADAQASGIAEPDASLDIEGWDTAVKTLILAKSLMERWASAETTRLDQINRIGIGPAIEELIGTGRRMKRVVRLIGRARFHHGGVRVSVAPKLVEEDSPLYSVPGTSKLAIFRTSSGREVIASAPSSRDAIARTIADDIVRIAVRE